MDCFEALLPEKELHALSNLGFAHIGDAVYELMVRTRLVLSGKETAGTLHRATVALVSAPAQARAAEKLMPLLSEEEADIFRRGRNAHVHGIPRRATPEEYHAATGLETLFGYLYLTGRRNRLAELFEAAMKEDSDGA